MSLAQEACFRHATQSEKLIDTPIPMRNALHQISRWPLLYSSFSFLKLSFRGPTVNNSQPSHRGVAVEHVVQPGALPLPVGGHRGRACATCSTMKSGSHFFAFPPNLESCREISFSELVKL